MVLVMAGPPSWPWRWECGRALCLEECWSAVFADGCGWRAPAWLRARGVSRVLLGSGPAWRAPQSVLGSGVAPFGRPPPLGCCSVSWPWPVLGVWDVQGRR